MSMNIRGALPLCALALAGCGSVHDTTLNDRRSTEIFGSSQPWFEGGGAPLEPESAELHSYVRFGLLHNAGLRAAFHRWRAALEVVPQVTELPDPVFSYAHFVEELETRTGPQRQRFSLQQTFPWFGVLELRGEVAAQQAESMWWRVTDKQLKVERDIKNAYYEYAYLAQAVRIDDENLRVLRRLEPVVQRRVQAGGNQADLLRLQVEIGKLENELETLRKFQPALSARLSAAMNRRSTVPLPWPDPLEVSVSAIDVEGLAMRALRDNPELAAMRQESERAETRADLADRERWPDLTLGADYFETGAALLPGTPGSGDDPIALRVSFELPIWAGKYDAAVREAERHALAAHGELQHRKNHLRSSLEQVAYELDDAGRQIALYRDTLLPRAKQTYEVTQTAYQGGKATLLDVIDAERTLLTFEKSYWRAVSSYAQALAGLESMCGGEI